MFENIRSALNLVTHRDRIVLAFVVLAQAVLGLLDMLAIALLGLVVGFASAAALGGSSSMFGRITNLLGLMDPDPMVVALWFAVFAAALLIAKSVLSFFLTRKTFSFLAARQALVSGRLAAKLLEQPLLNVTSRSSQANAYALTTGVSSAMLGILGQAVVVASEVALLLVLSIGLFLISPFVTLFTYIFFLLVALLIHQVISKRAGKLGITAAEADISSMTSMQNALRSYREAFVTGRRQLYVRNFQEMRWVSATVQADLYLMTQVPKFVFDAALVVGGGLLVLSQSLASSISAGLATIAIFYVAASRIMPSLMRMQGALIDMKHARGMAKSTFELASELHYDNSEIAVDENDHEGHLRRILDGIARGYTKGAPGIRLRDVAVTYPGSVKPALKGIGLKIEPGTVTAIVGSTGAGKSTLADLILGILEPDEGTVEIDGVSPQEGIRRSPGFIAYVPQDIVVVSGTIRENVGLGLPHDEIDDALVWEALERSSLDGFLRHERLGLETLVGEHGMRLSGGQRQRLGLARALYTQPTLIVLDEATSALDASTEWEVSEALRRMRGKTTQVVVAHRLATIRDADKVVFLEQGALVTSGTFDEVRRASSIFDHQAKLLGL